ncbi:hypothetical protein ACGFJ7_15850 [Actinoplanes sp. NPDC048988]|uniref:mechanosensitive ion channel family protein n=1 Tax=Actinoplanes sp. NPDC048988 TaxID=3363901 RepID=UPI0037164A2D
MEDVWHPVLRSVPTALAFAAVVLIGWLVARLLRTAVTKGLARAGLDRATPFRVVPSVLCGKIVFYGVLLFALQLAFGLWGPNPVSDLLTAIIAWLPRAFVAIVIVVVALAIGRAAADLIVNALGALPYARALARAVSIIIATLGVIAALDEVGIATSVTRPVLIAILATIAGVIIVGVGGGLIRPMQARWEYWLTRAAAESTTIRDQARAYAAERQAAPTTEPAPAPAPATEPAAAPAAQPAAPAAQPAAPAAQPAAAPAASSADETQVIPPPRSAPAPSEPAPDGETTSVITSRTDDTTVVNPGRDDTVVIGADETQMIPPPDTTTTRPLPTDPDKR